MKAMTIRASRMDGEPVDWATAMSRSLSAMVMGAASFTLRWCSLGRIFLRSLRAGLSRVRPLSIASSKMLLTTA